MPLYRLWPLEVGYSHYIDSSDGDGDVVVLISELRAWARPSGPGKLY
jgi:hypothetical protein